MNSQPSTPWSRQEWAAMLEKQWSTVAAAYTKARDEAESLRAVYEEADHRANEILHELNYLQKYRDAYAAVLRPNVTIPKGDL